MTGASKKGSRRSRDASPAKHLSRRLAAAAPRRFLIHAITGRLSHTPNCFSIAMPRLHSVPSSNRRPRSVMPCGEPLSLNPQRIVRDGCPVLLVINLAGRGDKDVQEAARLLEQRG